MLIIKKSISISALVLTISLNTLFAQTSIEELDSKAVVSFSVMSDNKGYAMENEHMFKCDKWTREAGSSFILGLGDHVKDNRMNPFLEFIKTDIFWHNKFYPNVADGENEYWGENQGDWGAGAPILNYVDLASRDNVKMRKNKCEYYAIEKNNGVKVHIIQLHYSDTPTEAQIAFNKNTRKYLKKTLKKIHKKDNDIIIILAHTEEWIDDLDKDFRAKVLKKADLLLDATTHRFRKYELSGNEAKKGAIAFNTGAVGNSRENGFVQVHVLENPLRMVIQYQKTAKEERELQGKGFAYEKIIDGKIREIDWSDYSID